MAKSKTEVEFHKGFGQDDIDKFIKRVPVYDKRHGHTVPPYIKYVQNGYKSYRNRNVTTIKFKFYFIGTADIEVLLYGTTFMSTTTSTTTVNYTTVNYTGVNYTAANLSTTTPYSKYLTQIRPRNYRNS